MWPLYRDLSCSAKSQSCRHIVQRQSLETYYHACYLSNSAFTPCNGSPSSRETHLAVMVERKSFQNKSHKQERHVHGVLFGGGGGGGVYYVTGKRAPVFFVLLGTYSNTYPALPLSLSIGQNMKEKGLLKSCLALHYRQ